MELIKGTLKIVIASLIFILGIIGGIKAWQICFNSTYKQGACQEVEIVPTYNTAFDLYNPKKDLMDALKFYEIHHADIVYAQAVLETGNFKSRLCIGRNNLFGLYDNRRQTYFFFNHWIESVIMYKTHIQNRYKDGEDYYEFLTRIHYAKDVRYIDRLKEIVNSIQ